MSDQVNPERAEEQVSSESGLLLSSEPLPGGGSLRALGDDGADTDASDSDGGITDDAGGDADASDADASDADASDSDGTDGGDSTESESGLGGENPLGLNRERAVKNGDDKDTRDT